ncbi:MAG: alpha/beta fold hydrolase [Comamonas sp.]
MYQPQRPSTTEDLPIRNMAYRVRTWGQPQPGIAPLVLVHGWMDVGASYQFVVDAFSEAFYQGRHIIAPDWRGFGHSMPAAPCDHYTFSDYLGDLDALLDHYVPEGQAIDLVGHSMGGNVVMLYAGARPERIRRLINLEGFGLPATQPAQAPQRMGRWLDELKSLRAGAMDLKTYDSQAAVAARLQKTNPRLSADKAHWLAGEWAAPDATGRWSILGDAAHKVVNPYLFQVDESLAHYAAITAPVLAIEASEESLGQWWKEQYTLDEYHQRLQSVRNCRIAQIDDAGHMLHHDQPQQVAQLIEDFCAGSAPQ